jgi:DNA-binding winged helix-turn-helix (wHTH) protein/TolB-like protein/tetratricopeptide (TPR) repeat protein
MDKGRNCVYEFEEFKLDPQKRLLFRDGGEAISLMPKAFEILHYLVEHAGSVVEKDEIMAAIWPDTAVEENNLTQNISTLRRLLGEKHRDNRFIATVPGKGYKFVAEVRETPNPPQNELSPVDDPETAEAAHKSNGQYNQESRNEITRKYGLTPKWMFAGAGALVIIVAAFIWLSWGEAENEAIRSIAVLPFNIVEPTSETEYLSEGIAENVINSLSHLADLKVISRNSTFRFKGVQPDSKAIGSQLGVEAIITGDIRQVGDDLVINVRLIRTRDDAQIWGNQYVKRPMDLIGVQSEIAQAVVRNLKVRLTQTETRLMTKRETNDPEAWELYQRGRFHVFRLTPDEAQKGLGYFREAIKRDPNYALAYAGIGDAYRSLALSIEMPPIEYLSLSKEASLKAIELDDSLPEGHVGLGLANFWGDWNWAEAEQQYVRALELNPNDGIAHLFYAHLHSNLGRHDAALEKMKKFRELDPIFPLGNALDGQFLLHAGKPDEALDRLAKTLEIAPNFWMPHLFISAVNIEKGEFEKAIAAARRASELSPAQTLALSFEAFALARAGRTGEAESILERLLERSKERFVPPYHIALVYHGLRDRRALDWLVKGLEVRDPKMTFLKVDQKWNDLRDEPQFVEIMRRMNFN